MLLDARGVPLPSAKRALTTSNPKIAQFVSQADTPFRVLDLTVVCRACGATPQMANASSDATWAMDCACTTRRLTRRTLDA